LEVERSATAEYLVRGDEPFLAGHFPGEPLFPGVLLIEAAAQLAGIVAQSARIAGQSGTRLRLTAVRSIKILDTARPGETIKFEARLVQRLGHLVQAEVSVSVDSRTLLKGELTLSSEEPPKV
jgi:3-hydroxymyristoyl/3-hydroxydecanoyl-(acyl carrier protein) dehydratase